MAGDVVIGADLLVGPDVAGSVAFSRTIDSIGPAGRVSEHFPIVCGGFVDVQVNGIDEHDVWSICSRGDIDSLHAVENRLLDRGVTSWLPTLVSHPLPDYAAALDFLSAAPSVGAERLGVHLEGPFLGGAPGAHRRDAIVGVDHRFVGNLPDAVRLMTIGAETPGAVEAITALTARGVVCSIGHSRPGRDEFERATAAGARMVTHLFNAMSGLHHRDPGLAAWALSSDLWCGLVADGVHVHPDMIELAFRIAAERIVLVSDSVARFPGVEVRDGAPRLPDGTIAGSVLTLDRAVATCVSVGVAPSVALRAASLAPATVIGAHDRGLIEVGRRADLVALNERYEVIAVWQDGRRVR